MFTGIIETLGTIRSKTPGDKSARLALTADRADYTVASGDSVAIDGVCLTLEESADRQLFFRAVDETLSRTTLGSLKTGSRVNLERAVRPVDRLGGHFVLGHVDGVGRISEDRKQGDSLIRAFEVAPEVSRFLAEKGSVAVDGISLTVVSASAGRFSVSFIPYSLAHTTMALKRPGDAVNIEIDILARYTFRLLEAGALAGPADRGIQDHATLYEKMERSGF
jgi:riboflavin synthase